MSFGTGDHITTRFCLEAIDRLCRPRPAASLLDAGTGSGILAIAAAKLGVPRIVAIDSDPLAVAQARENLRMNRVAGRVRLRTGDITSAAPLGRFDVVCANLFGGLLIRAAARLCRAARRRLVLGGIREIEADAVADAYAALGAREIERDGDGEWCGLVFDLAPIAGTADQGAARNPRKGNRRM
jgi:ribosomal protein L11 methyltransferase